MRSLRRLISALQRKLLLLTKSRYSQKTKAEYVFKMVNNDIVSTTQILITRNFYNNFLVASAVYSDHMYFLLITND